MSSSINVDFKKKESTNDTNEYEILKKNGCLFVKCVLSKQVLGGYLRGFIHISHEKTASVNKALSPP